MLVIVVRATLGLKDFRSRSYEVVARTIRFIKQGECASEIPVSEQQTSQNQSRSKEGSVANKIAANPR